MKKSYIVAGGAFASILAVALISSTHLTEIEQITIQNQPLQEPVIAAPEKKPEAKEERERNDAARIQQEAAAPQVAAAPAAPMPASAPPPPAEMLMAKKVDGLKSKDSRMGAGHAGGVGAVARDESVANRAVAGSSFSLIAPQQPYYQDYGRDKFSDIKENNVKAVQAEPVSTFSIDVDTASYSFMRATLNNNAMPPADAVRTEELINYFPYEYEAPKDKAQPFKANVSVFATPWNADTKLMHIGIKGYQLEQKEKPRSNLVFLVDTSGSMNAPDKLPLLRNSLKLLLDSLKDNDTVSIVTYAGSAGTALEPTKVKDKAKILAVLDNMTSGGSTAGAAGIRQAYTLAEQNLDKEGVNRVILATDGDFNVGITDPEELKRYVEEKRKTGVFLSVLGFGQGNYNDALMQTLAQNGNGNAAYIDNLNEARKVLVEEAGSTLFTIAKDVKIQVEFNPAVVAEYRLVGYETRLLNREDFNNDKVDAGEIGAGHTVTAIYEITPVGSKSKQVDPLRYQKEEKAGAPVANNGEYGFVKIRYKLPNEDVSKLITQAVDASAEKNVSADARFAAAVAAFGQKLRGESFTQGYSYDDLIASAEAAKGADKFGYRAEFVNLARLAKTMAGMQTGVEVQPGIEE